MKPHILRPRPDAGFLLLVIIGVLALMLTICIGFISMTRGELQGVLTIRDRADGQDLARSAVDWNIGVISKDLFAGNQFDDTKQVTNARAAGYQWWYRPYERGLKDVAPTWPVYKNFGKLAGFSAASMTGYPYYYTDPTRSAPLPDCIDPSGKDQAEWTYLPADHFPNNTRARFMTLVWDPNSLPCINDWLEDCNPTQCQMAHMIRDGYGEQFVEREREWRDGGSNLRGGTFVTGTGKVTGVGDLATAPDQPQRVPLRYHEAWRVATRSLRYTHWNSGYLFSDGSTIGGIHRWLSPNWVTTNTTYWSNYAAEMYCLKPLWVTDGFIMNKTVPQQPLATIASPGVTSRYYPPTPYEGFKVNQQWWDPGWGNLPETYDTKWSQSFMPVGMPFSLYAYVDPDTGRAPVNVNSTYNSGERLPQNIFNGTPVFTMEAVFNVDSLKRLIQIEKFCFDWNLDGIVDPATETMDVTYAGAVGTVQKPAAWGAMPAAQQDGLLELAKIKLDELKTRLAYQYQETLCRYFTATYRHPMSRKYPPYWNPAAPAAGVEDFSDPGTYQTVYGASIPGMCQKYDYSDTRFPYALDGPDNGKNFRHIVYLGFQQMDAGTALVQCGWDATKKVDTFVNVAQGKLDTRTLAACYDNIVPGKPPASRSFTGITWGDPATDPILQIYTLKLGRDELAEDSNESGFTTLDTSVTPAGRPVTTTATKLQAFYNAAAATEKPMILLYSRGVFGHHSDDPGLFDSGNSSFVNDDPVNIKQDTTRFLNLRPKGAEVTGTSVPWRQLAFGPDSFSTELTTASTTFIMIVTAQLLDAESLALDANNPRDFFSGQWGYVVELAPDVRTETPSGYDGNNWATTTSATEIGLGFYKGTNMNSTPNMRWPEYLKRARTTDVAGSGPAAGQVVIPQFPANEVSYFYSMDTRCSTVKTMHGWINQNQKQWNIDPLETVPDNRFQIGRASFDDWNQWRTSNSPDCWYDVNWGRCYQNESAARNWMDFRGVRPADAVNYYKGSSQAAKRVVIRTVWSHNQGTNK